MLAVEFTVFGQAFMGLNSGGSIAFTEVISFQVFTDDQAETDRLWTTITSGGGAESMCGWCRGRFGVSWQIIPRRLMEIMASPSQAAAQRGMAAMMTMRKIDIAALDAAYVGAGA